MHWTETATSEYSPTVLGLIFMKGAQASRLFLPKQTAKMAVPPSYTPSSLLKTVASISMDKGEVNNTAARELQARIV